MTTRRTTSDIAQLHLAVAIFTLTLAAVLLASMIGGTING